MGTVESLSAPVLKAQSVPSAYFIAMVRSYEAKYQMDWLTFYTEHQHSKEESNEDFSDWLFLCRAYFADLVAANGPPPAQGCSQKPERDSGFCFLRDKITSACRLIRSITSTSSTKYSARVSTSSVISK